MPSEHEEALATEWEHLLQRHFDLDPGLRTAQDGQIDPQLTVDFTYDQVSPPLALEITGLYNPVHEATLGQANKLRARLAAVAFSEGLGTWLITIASGTRVKGLETALLPLLRGVSAVGPFHRGQHFHAGVYTSFDIAQWMNAGTRDEMLRLHRQFKNLGIHAVDRLERTDDSVVLSVIGDQPKIEGFSADIAHAARANAPKLAGAGNRRKHLLVSVERFNFSRFPQQTNAPALPPSIDALWIFFKWHSEVGPPVWLLAKGAVAWTEIG